MKQTYLLFLLLSVFYCNTLFAQTNETYQLSTHILDIHLGEPAEGVTIVLFKYNTEISGFEIIDMGKTDSNGRVNNFLPANTDNKGAYKLQFDTHPYFTEQGVETIYPAIEVLFEIKDNSHYHIPITVSANGYSTYRGS